MRLRLLDSVTQRPIHNSQDLKQGHGVLIEIIPDEGVTLDFASRTGLDELENLSALTFAASFAGKSHGPIFNISVVERDDTSLKCT